MCEGLGKMCEGLGEACEGPGGSSRGFLLSLVLRQRGYPYYVFLY